jgi:hypothetical protein
MPRSRETVQSDSAGEPRARRKLTPVTFLCPEPLRRGAERITAATDKTFTTQVNEALPLLRDIVVLQLAQGALYVSEPPEHEKERIHLLF